MLFHKSTSFIFLGIIIFVLLFTLTGNSMATGLMIPRKNHYIYSPSILKRITGHEEYLIVETYVRNSESNIPVEIEAKVEEVKLVGNKLTPTGKTIKVVPSSVILYPDKRQKFEVHYPIPSKDGSEIYFFSINAVKDFDSIGGIRVTSGMGFHIMFTRAMQVKWSPQPYIVIPNSQTNTVIIKNLDSIFGFEGHIMKFDNGKVVQGYSKHVFIPAGGSRSFEIPNLDANEAVVFDCGGFPKRVGKRLR